MARVSATTAAALGVADGAAVRVSTDDGAVTVPLVVSDIVDGVVWLPAHSPGCSVLADLGVDPATPAVVRLAPGGTS